MSYVLGLTHMTWVAIFALRIDPDLRVFDLKTEARLGAFVVTGEHPPGGLSDLAGRRIDALGRRSKGHALDAEIAKPGAGDRKFKGHSVAQKLHVALGGKNAEPLADRMLAAKAALVLEGLGELSAGIEALIPGLIEQNPQDQQIKNMDPAILDAFRSNPYTQSLTSVA